MTEQEAIEGLSRFEEVADVLSVDTTTKDGVKVYDITFWNGEDTLRAWVWRNETSRIHCAVYEKAA